VPSALLLGPLATIAVPAELLAHTAAFAAGPWSKAIPSVVATLVATGAQHKALIAAALMGCSILGAGLAGWALTFAEKTPESKSPITASNFVPFDKTRPAIDPEGRAIETVENIKIQDMTGPLTDKALFCCGYVSFIFWNFHQADRFFSELVEAHRNSPLRPQAVAYAILARSNAPTQREMACGYIAKNNETTQPGDVVKDFFHWILKAFRTLVFAR
jgi:hypothetical protein